jgi:hypothetical protein
MQFPIVRVFVDFALPCCLHGLRLVENVANDLEMELQVPGVNSIVKEVIGHGCEYSAK